MKRILAILALLCLLLTGCAAPQPEIPDDPAPDVEQDPDPIPPVDPEHSSLYLPDNAVEDVILYFNEVCLDAEVNNGGNPHHAAEVDQSYLLSPFRRLYR